MSVSIMTSHKRLNIYCDRVFSCLHDCMYAAEQNADNSPRYMHMLKTEEGFYPVLVRITRTDQIDGPDVLVRCVYNDTGLS